MKGREQDAMEDAEVCTNLLSDHVMYLYLIRLAPDFSSPPLFLCSPSAHCVESSGSPGFEVI